MLKQVKYSLIRLFMKTAGRLSNGIGLCYREGLTSGKMVDYIYRNRPSGKFFIGKLIDKRFLADPGWEAVRCRRKNLEDLMLEAVKALRKQNRAVSILDIASGPGAYILSVMERAGEGGMLVRCRDFESRWVEEGKREAAKRNLKNVHFEKGDAFDRQEILSLTPCPNLVVASGFYDWFNDDNKIKESLRIVFDALEAGGYFVLSNQCRHPKLEFTEQVFTDFNKAPLKMTMRSQELMASFLTEAGFAVEETRTDEHGYYTVLKAVKY